MPIMSLEAIAATGTPSEDLHENGYLEAYDDLTGAELDPSLMKAARKEEIAFFRGRKVYEKVDVAESWRVTGAGPIGVRWVDINKGDNVNPKYRSRLVAKEFNTGVRPDLYAATPPSECLRLLLSKFATDTTLKFMYADVSRVLFLCHSHTPRVCAIDR